MKTKKLMSTALITLLSLTLTVNVFAAGGNQSGGAASGSGGLVTLDVYSGPANTSGIQANKYWTEILKEDLNIQLNILPQNSDLFNAMMASGELADVVIVHEYAQTIDMIKAGLLLNLDEQRAKLPNVYANIPSAIQYMRDNVSNGTGNLYALPNSITNRPQQTGTFNFGPYIRWDLYKEQGSPVLNEIEDYLPLLKKMVDAHPTNAAGQKVYGFGGFTDWDGNANGAVMLVAGMIGNFYGGERENYLYAEVDYINNTTRSILDDNSWYKRGLKFWYTANQMGLVDPDSPSQTWSEYQTKATANRILFSWWSWGWGDSDTQERLQQKIGFKLVPFTKERQYVAAPTYVGNAWSYHIAKNAKNLDAALRFVDYMYSYDGLLNLSLGRKGVYWDQDSSGEPYITQLGWDIKNQVREFPNGGRLSDGLNTINSFGLSGRNIHPTLKRELSTDDWIKKDFAPPDTALVADWKSVMKAEDDLDYFAQHNMLVQKPFAPLAVPPDNILQIAARVGQVIQPMSWQIAFARDEAEFNRLWADMVQRAKGVGIDTVNQWYLDEFNRAKAAAAKYAK
ncbi:MAG: extracellular solute-binding protein [Treponema sp.]|jgi:putative aldouronate transport system substrate-binding protein|nr:extracellular solute-binding protein [Treponema sp.]